MKKKDFFSQNSFKGLSLTQIKLNFSEGESPTLMTHTMIK